MNEIHWPAHDEHDVAILTIEADGKVVVKAKFTGQEWKRIRHSIQTRPFHRKRPKRMRGK